jgi:isopenicillin-N N-acyltransferase-like protein
MKKTTGLFIAIIFVFSLIPYRTFGQIQSSSAKRNLRVLVLEGTPYMRGLQHGKSLKKDIHALVDLWKADIEKKHKIDPDVFIKKFLEYTDFPAAIRRWTPELLEEVRGIADGSGQDYETIFAFQLVDEMWVLGSEMLASNPETKNDFCTTIGTQKSPGTPSMVSQTLDIPTFYHGFQTLLLIKEPDSDLQSMIFTFPGFIAANGMNSSAVAVVVNAVQQLEHSRNGLPVAFVIRGILQKKTYQEAVRFIHAVRFGAPQNYMIGGPENVGSFECSAFHVEQFLPFPGSRFAYHTNHPLKNKHFTPEIQNRFKSRNIDPLEYTFKCQRYEALQRILKDNDVELDIEKLKDIYRNRETFINNRSTFGTTIMVLSENPELHISAGRPDEASFQIFRFDGFHSHLH